MVTLYTTSTCPMCKMLKQRLDEKNIEYKTINDVEILQEKNIMHVPVLEVNNELFNLQQALVWLQEA